MSIDTFGIFTWFGFLAPMTQRLSQIADTGFHAVTGWWGPEFSNSDGDYRHVPEEAQRAGLVYENGHLPYYSVDCLWRDSLDEKELLSIYRTRIEEAGTLSVPVLVIHPFEKKAPMENISRFADNLLRLGDAAQKASVRLAVENLFDNETLLRIMDRVDNPIVGHCFDSGHNNIEAPGDFTVLKELGNRLFAVHIHDNEGKNDSHLLPYMGNIDWPALKEMLDVSSYGGSLTLEAAYPYSEDSEGNFSNPPIRSIEYLLDAKERCLAVLANEKDFQI